MDMGQLSVDRSDATLRAQVFKRLHQAITTGLLRPGQRLVERELCEMLDVSRPLVREAIRQLESEGLVTVAPYRGPTVTQLTREMAEDAYRVRGVLEALASQLFAERADQASKVELRRSFEDLAIAYSSRDTGLILEKKTVFYDTLLRGSGSTTAHSLLRQIHARVTLLRATSLSRPARLDASIAEVQLIVEAIEAGDGAAAWQRTIDHINAASAAALSALPSVASGDATLQ
ncbi:MAG: GntR family transcriptional regulator [Mesorhizobium sp.]